MSTLAQVGFRLGLEQGRSQTLGNSRVPEHQRESWESQEKQMDLQGKEGEPHKHFPSHAGKQTHTGNSDAVTTLPRTTKTGRAPNLSRGLALFLTSQEKQGSPWSTATTK